MKESEPALQTTGDLWIRALPAAPFSQRSNPWQIIRCTQPFQQQIAKRRGGFTNHHPRMLALFQQDDREAELMGNHRHQAAAKAGADDREVIFASQLAPPQTVHGILSEYGLLQIHPLQPGRALRVAVRA